MIEMMVLIEKYVDSRNVLNAEQLLVDLHVSKKELKMLFRLFQIDNQSVRQKSIQPLAPRIKETYTQNWEKRQEILREIEEYMQLGKYEEAEHHFCRHPGALKVSKYKQIKQRYIRKEVKRWMSRIDGLQLIDQGNVTSVDSQAADLLDENEQAEYQKIRDNRVLSKGHDVRNLITELLSSGKYEEADSIYNLYQLYLPDYNYTLEKEASMKDALKNHLDKINYYLMREQYDEARSYFEDNPTEITESQFRLMVNEAKRKSGEKRMKAYQQALNEFDFN